MSAAAFIVAPAGSDHGELFDVDTDGSVNWKLAPGEYELVALRLIHRNGSSLFQINGHLSVSADQPITRIGVIRAENGSFGPRVRVMDSSDASASEPEEHASAPSRPLQFQRITVGSFAKLVDICAPRWWLQCTRSFNGVEAVEPKVLFGPGGPLATRTDSVQPRFSWRTTLTAGAAYDIAAWQGISYKPNALASTQYVPGPVAFYAENLEQPEFTPATPLQPKTRYFWSVRVRQGDTVSTWSTTGHFTFLLVAWSQSSGQRFEFDTP